MHPRSVVSSGSEKKSSDSVYVEVLRVLDFNDTVVVTNGIDDSVRSVTCCIIIF